MSTSNYTLLYVEDDEQAQEQMKALLEDSVQELYQAYNGEEGLAIFKDKNPDIVITDISMPVMDGIEMSEAIKKIDSKKQIIMISAFEDRSYLERAIKIKVDYFISKPIDFDILENGLESITKQLRAKNI
jgi:YesN/AraC family two-component response regulator